MFSITRIGLIFEVLGVMFFASDLLGGEISKNIYKAIQTFINKCTEFFLKTTSVVTVLFIVVMFVFLSFLFVDDFFRLCPYARRIWNYIYLPGEYANKLMLESYQTSKFEYYRNLVISFFGIIFYVSLFGVLLNRVFDKEIFSENLDKWDITFYSFLLLAVVFSMINELFLATTLVSIVVFFLLSIILLYFFYEFHSLSVFNMHRYALSRILFLPIIPFIILMALSRCLGIEKSLKTIGLVMAIIGFSLQYAGTFLN